jgi:hypothetical protein
MPPRTKSTKNVTTGTSARAEKEKVSGWERSKFSKKDHHNLKKLGLLVTDGAVQIPGDEAIPNPPEGFQVIFTDFLLRGLSIPVHQFLRGLLFIYGIQLYKLTPNYILPFPSLSHSANASLASIPTRPLGKYLLPSPKQLEKRHLQCRWCLFLCANGGRIF